MSVSSFSPRGSHSTRVKLIVAAFLAAGFGATGFLLPGLSSRQETLRADDKPKKPQQTGEQAKRNQSKNNLKKLVLAMHNYHDKHAHFPPAVLMGPDGKTPHSWRIELLPFLDEKPLYDQYKQDEPWDSENNKKVLAKMPAVFLDPANESNDPNSCYFVITGEKTLFSDKKGTRIRDVKDGTSNTFMIVEAQRDIPWTKPEDIAYDAKKDPPKLGGFHDGGFLVAFCDGSVRFASEPIEKVELQHLIEIADGHPVKSLDTSPPPRSGPQKAPKKSKGLKKRSKE